MPVRLPLYFIEKRKKKRGIWNHFKGHCFLMQKLTFYFYFRVFDPPEDNPMQRFSKSVVPQGKRVKDQTFAFDRVFDENTSQADVYEATTKNLLDSVLDGYNATVFAYGATGCGKTHTITSVLSFPTMYLEIILINMSQWYCTATWHHFPHNARAFRAHPRVTGRQSHRNLTLVS